MVNNYITKQGDMLDVIANQLYGERSADSVARILAINPRLCEQPALLPAGIKIIMPERTLALTQQEVKLWD